MYVLGYKRLLLTKYFAAQSDSAGCLLNNRTIPVPSCCCATKQIRFCPKKMDIVDFDESFRHHGAEAFLESLLLKRMKLKKESPAIANGSALTHYKMDRASLSECGLDREKCDEVYRTLMVHTQGVYSSLHSFSIEDKSFFWKIFLILAETIRISDAKNKINVTTIEQEIRERYEAQLNDRISYCNSKVKESTASNLQLFNKVAEVIIEKTSKLQQQRLEDVSMSVKQNNIEKLKSEVVEQRDIIELLENGLAAKDRIEEDLLQHNAELQAQLEHMRIELEEVRSERDTWQSGYRRVESSQRYTDFEFERMVAERDRMREMAKEEVNKNDVLLRQMMSLKTRDSSLSEKFDWFQHEVEQQRVFIDNLKHVCVDSLSALQQAADEIAHLDRYVKTMGSPLSSPIGISPATCDTVTSADDDKDLMEIFDDSWMFLGVLKAKIIELLNIIMPAQQQDLNHSNEADKKEQKSERQLNLENIEMILCSLLLASKVGKCAESEVLRMRSSDVAVRSICTMYVLPPHPPNNLST